ncbi:MAG: GNAT family N-acetyltransferase [Alphaproteobacteria bacterium]|nr:GNAT family N-acetyltransferase [Alphaproteobacteria bacterium]
MDPQNLNKENEINFDILPSTKEEEEIVINKIVSFNNLQEKFINNNLIFNNYIIKDCDEIIAGINSVITYWNILFISILFVDENHRGKNLGSLLLRKVEDEAKSLGVTLVHLDTFDFQAKDFYLKHGYEIFGILDDCPKDHKRYYLKKSL